MSRGMLSQKGGNTRRVQAAKLYPRGIQIRIVLFLQETDWPVGRQDQGCCWFYRGMIDQHMPKWRYPHWPFLSGAYFPGSVGQGASTLGASHTRSEVTPGISQRATLSY